MGLSARSPGRDQSVLTLHSLSGSDLAVEVARDSVRDQLHEVRISETQAATSTLLADTEATEYWRDSDEQSDQVHKQDDEDGGRAGGGLAAEGMENSPVPII